MKKTVILSITITIADMYGSTFFDWWERAAEFRVDKDEIKTAATLPQYSVVVGRENH